MDFDSLVERFYQTEEETGLSRTVQVGQKLLNVYATLASWVSPVVACKLEPGDKTADQHLSKGVYLDTSYRLARRHSGMRLAGFCLYVVYVICDLIYWTGYIQVGILWRDRYNSWNPTVTPASSRNGSCVIASDVQRDHPGELALDQARPVRTIYGEDAMFVFYDMLELLAGARLSYWVWILGGAVLISLRSPIRIPALSLFADPSSEKARSLRQLISIAQNSVAYPDQVEQQMLELGLDNRSCSLSRSPRDLVCEGPLFNRQTRHDLVLELRNSKPWTLVKPASISAGSRKAYSMTVISTAALLVYGTTIGSVNTIAWVHSSLILPKIEQCQQQVRCERWHPQGQLLKPLVDFREEFWTDSSRLCNKIRLSNESEPELVWLETRRLLTEPRYSLFVLAQYLIIIFAHSNLHIVWLVFTPSYHYQVRWLSHIRRQLNLLTNMMDLHIEDRCNYKPYRMAGSAGSADAARLAAIHKAMNVVYLNFELFRRQYEDFKSIANFFAISRMVDWLCWCGLIYWLYNSTSKEYDLSDVVVFTVMLITQINVLFWRSSELVARVEKLTVQQLGVIARSAHLSVNLSHVVGLWRRQLLNDEDLHSHYAMSVLGVELSYENLIALDSNLLGMALVLYKIALEQSAVLYLDG